MTKNYDAKRQHWLKLVEQLPPEIRSRVPIRNVVAVSALPHKAQMTLAQALDAGLKRFPSAIQVLKINPDASVEDLLQARSRLAATEAEANANRQPAHLPTLLVEARTVLPAQSPTQLPNAHDVSALADLFQFAHPGAGRIVAEAWAEDSKWANLLDLVQAWEEHIATPPGTRHSETVIVVTCALLVKARERINQLLAERPAYQVALKMSGVPWPEIK